MYFKLSSARSGEETGSLKRSARGSDGGGSGGMRHASVGARRSDVPNRPRRRAHDQSGINVLDKYGKVA